MQTLLQTLTENVVFMLLLLPLIGAVLVLASSRLGIEVVRRTALTNVLLTFMLSILMVVHYDPQMTEPSGRARTIQMSTSIPWLDASGTTTDEPAAVESAAVATLEEKFSQVPNVRIAVGVDGISLWFVALTALLTIPAVIAESETDRERPAVYYALLLLLESGLIGLFAALDVVFLYVCLESTLMIVLFLIGGWGGHGRRPAIRKLFVYNLAGSLLILLGLIWLAQAHARMRSTENDPRPPITFATYQIIDGTALVRGDLRVAGIQELTKSSSAADHYWNRVSPWIFLALLVGFAIKTPVFPFHTWLPGANTEAPSAVSILLIGVALKVGLYGLVRFLLPLFPNICLGGAGFLSSVAVLGSVYAGLLAMAQGDVKKLTTYASLSQFGLCAAGIFSLNRVAVVGSLLHAIAHGLSVAVILFLIGVLDRRYHTREIEAFGGLASAYPRFGLLFLFAALSFIGVPGLAGFSGETLTLMGIFAGPSAGLGNPLGTLSGLAGCLLVAWTFLWLIQRLLHGRFRRPDVSALVSIGSLAVGHDPSVNLAAPASAARGTSAAVPKRSSPSALLTGRQFVVGLVLAAMMLWVGVAPQFFISRIEPSVARVLSVYSTGAEPSEEGQTNHNIRSTNEE